jgi:hypothetical protein
MSEVLTKIVVDCSTGVTSQVPLTGEELEQRELDAIAAATSLAEKEAADAAKVALKASAKEKLVLGQPLTAEEAETLVF